MSDTILVTGAAGFVGFHAIRHLLRAGFRVVGVDNLNDYYSVSLKRARLDALSADTGFTFHRLDIADAHALKATVGSVPFTHILHLAAQAGVRYSLQNPHAYVRSNVVGHLNVLELARATPTLRHMMYASSSSVYGDRADGPFHENDRVRNPASLYAATKLSGEMMSQSYASLYGIAQTGLRFFTVYGPWGRPDMAYFIFTDRIMRGEPIELFAPDQMVRDFTFIDDIARTLPIIAHRPPASKHAIYNLGNSRPNTLMELVEAVEAACGRKAEKMILPKEKGDVSYTFADVTAAERDFGFRADTSLSKGVTEFVDWYKASWRGIAENT